MKKTIFTALMILATSAFAQSYDRPHKLGDKIDRSFKNNKSEMAKRKKSRSMSVFVGDKKLKKVKTITYYFTNDGIQTRITTGYVESNENEKVSKKINDKNKEDQEKIKELREREAELNEKRS